MTDEQETLSYALARRDEWEKWTKEIPSFPLKENWHIHVIPPFHNAIVRFRIYDINKPDSFTSVYLDCYERLGSYGKPYWEVYPIIQSDNTWDTGRVAMNDVSGLLRLIEESLNVQ